MTQRQRHFTLLSTNKLNHQNVVQNIIGWKSKSSNKNYNKYAQSLDSVHSMCRFNVVYLHGRYSEEFLKLAFKISVALYLVELVQSDEVSEFLLKRRLFR